MTAAGDPKELERLASLRDYDILDTPREREFDEIVGLVAKLCEVPVAAINLIDADRQWFKAEVGLGAREKPLDMPVSSRAILESSLLEIPDTRHDDRTRDNESCRDDQGLRFYAGVVLKTSAGVPIGTLCVFDYKPRVLTPLQKEVLQVFARQVMTQLDLRLVLKRERETRSIVEERTEKLNRALEEQKIISREIDHRVKNSLQIISSLLRIQKQKAVEPETVAALSATEGRVDAVAMLHQELHQAGPFDKVDLEHLVANIVKLLRRSCPSGVALLMDFEAVNANAQKATAVAVIVNEFVTNSIKYAFPDNRKGEVLLSGRRIDDERYEVVLLDDGIGLSPEQALGASDGLGIMIMEASASRLETVMDFRPPPRGTRLAFSFVPS